MITIEDQTASFNTTGDGLRGVPVLFMDRDTGALEFSRVYSNTGTVLTLDTPLSRNAVAYDAYVLGSIPFAVESGDLPFNNVRAIKNLHYFTLEFPKVTTGNIILYLAADQANQEEAEWSYAASEYLNGVTYLRLPLQEVPDGTGRVIRWVLMAMEPGVDIEISHVSITYDVQENFSD